MRMSGLILAVVLVSACSDRRTFEERYGETASEIENRAEKLDARMNEAEANTAAE